MGKVRVARSIARAYSFSAGHLFGILGTSWLPATFFAALCAWWIGALGSEAHAIANGSLPRALGQTLLFLCGAALLLSSISIPLTRAALGEERESSFAHFVFGRRELRLFFGLLRFLGVVLAALIIFATAFTLAVQGGMVHFLATLLPGPKGFSPSAGEIWRGIPLRRAVADAGAASMLVVMAVIGLRFGFFLAPLAAVDDRAKLSRAAQLSGRSFWRLLAVSAAVVLPTMAVVGFLCFAILGPAARANIAHAYGTGALDDLLAIIGVHAVPLAIVCAGSAVLFLALIAGASSNAYRDCIEGVDESEAVRRQPATDQRDSGTQFQDEGLVPAFAKVHPLATLLSEGNVAADAGLPHEGAARETAPSPVLQEVVAPVDAMVDVVPELTTPIETSHVTSPTSRAETPAAPELEVPTQAQAAVDELSPHAEGAPLDAELATAELPPQLIETVAQQEREPALSEG
jgi:hypothetical protein